MYDDNHAVQPTPENPDGAYIPEPTDEELEASIESKVVCIRDGSCTYTADEICQNLVSEASALLGIDLGLYDCPESEYSEAIGELADQAENLLFDAGYYVFHNDGFVIYQGLTQEESDYLGGY